MRSLCFLAYYCKEKIMVTLGIETSCDETAIALYDSNSSQIIAEKVYSQIDLHAAYGGVVPELASRDHCAKIINVLDQCMADYDLKNIDQIAYTAGPGLIGALLIGENLAHGLSISLNKPVVPINHLEAHLHAPKIDQNIHLDFPFITLLVSGGHSMIIKVNKLGDYELLGDTRDDAVGEAFDKVAKLLNLGYPGGPILEKIAMQGDSSSFSFPQPMAHSNDCDMSFSGLKTAVLYAVEKLSTITDQHQADIAASFQESATEILVKKIDFALSKNSVKDIVLAGGVAANKLLRSKMDSLADKKNINLHYPPLRHCTDNAAMVAYLGSLYSEVSSYNLVSLVKPRWPLHELKL